MSFPCPDCGHPQTCPCEACQSRNPTEKPWVWINGDVIGCGGCGLINHADWWTDQEYAYIKKQEEKTNEST